MNASLVLAIADDGPGLEPNVIASGRVLEPFAAFRGGAGTGPPDLGLAVVRSVVVDGMGGSVKVSSGLGLGTVVLVRIPVKARRLPRNQLAVGSSVGCVADSSASRGRVWSPGAATFAGPLRLSLSPRFDKLSNPGHKSRLGGHMLPSKPSPLRTQRSLLEEPRPDQARVLTQKPPAVPLHEVEAASRAPPRAHRADSSNAGSAKSARAKRRGERQAGRGRATGPGKRNPRLSGVAWVCDDDFATRSLLSSLLRRQGLRVEAFADGQDAVDRMRALLSDAGTAAGEEGAAGSLPRVLVVDGSMPRLGGVGTLAAVRAMRADAASLGLSGMVSALDGMRAIAVTGDASSEGRREFLEAGASSVIAKPVEADVLLASLVVVFRGALG